MWLVLAEALLVGILPLISDPAVTAEAGQRSLGGTTEHSRNKPQPVQARLQRFFESYTTLPPITVLMEGTTESDSRPVEPTLMRSAINTASLAAPSRSIFPAPRANLVNLRNMPPAKPKPSDPIIFEEPETMEPGAGWTVPPTTVRNSGGRMNFGEDTNAPSAEGKKEDCKDFETFFKGKCYTLLKQGPCAKEEWLIEKNGVAQCAKSKCQYPQFYYNGQCVERSRLASNGFMNCNDGMSIAVYRDGTVECDCSPGNILDPTSGKCFEAYRRGPCSPSQYFILAGDSPISRNVRAVENGTGGICSPNPCKEDTKVCYGATCPRLSRTAKCVQLNDLCEGDKLVMVSVLTLKVGCFEINSSHTPPKTIGNVPSFSCGRGSKRDVQGKCRPISTPSFS